MQELLPYRKIPWSVEVAVRQALRQWKRTNAIRESIAFPKWEATLLDMGERPWATCFCFALLALFAWLVGPPAIRHFVPAPALIWDPGSQISYFATLWSVQATLAALVFPIVIGFVTVFLQRRPSAEGLVHLYLLTSGGIISGISSIVLIIAMAIQYAAASVMDVEILKRWAAVDTGWFAVNSALTAVFLYRTMEFLRPQAQMRTVIRYAVHVSLPREITAGLRRQMLWSTHVQSWIPNTSVQTNKRERPEVVLQDFWSERGKAQIETNFSKPRQLADVRLWLLRASIESWLRRARLQVAPEPRGAFDRKSPCLALVARIGEVRTGMKSSVVVRDGPSLTTSERILMRSALVWKHARPERGVALRTLLAEMEEDARLAAARADYETFKQPYDLFVDLHENLLAAALFKDESGSPDSWAVLTEPGGWMSQSFHRSWANSYRTIFQACVDAAPRDSGPFERACQLPQHLAGEAVRNSPTEVSEQILMLPGLLRHLLSQWWTRNVAPSHPNHGANTPAKLGPPLDALYESMLRSFVAGWEQSRDALAEIPDNSEVNWSANSRVVQIYAFHLEKTASMVLSAASMGDIAAAHWFADVLSKWWGMLDHENDLAHFEDDTRFVTLDTLEQPWSDVAAEFRLGHDHWRGGAEGAQRGVLLAALRNHWTDIRWRTVEMLLAWATDGSNEQLTYSPCLDIAAGLLQGRVWKSGGTMSDALSSHGPDDYVQAKVRQYGSIGQGATYRGRLDKFIENAAGARDEPMVSARIYSRVGAVDSDSLLHAEMLVLGAISKTDWQPRQQTLRRLTDCIEHKYRAGASVKRWTEEFAKITLEPGWRSVLAEVASRVSPGLEVEEAVRRAAGGIEGIRNHIDGERRRALGDAQIEPGRLNQIATYASSKAFSTADGGFPLGLFKDISPSTSTLKPSTLRARSAKGELTSQEFSQRASNEDDWWQHTMRDHVAWIVMSDAVDQLAPRSIEIGKESEYWEQLRVAATSIRESGQQPILILENPTIPGWVWDLQHPRDGTPSAGEMTVSREVNMPKGYQFTANGIRVFSGLRRKGCSLVTAQEAFERLEFTSASDGAFVRVEAKGIDNDVEHVTLEATFWRGTHVSALSSVLLNYGEKSENDESEMNA